MSIVKVFAFVLTAAVSQAAVGELSVRVRPTAGGPQIHVDGKPVPPRFYFYWGGGARRDPVSVDADWRDFNYPVETETDVEKGSIHFRFGDGEPYEIELRNLHVTCNGAPLDLFEDSFATAEAFNRAWRVCPSECQGLVAVSNGCLNVMRTNGNRVYHLYSAKVKFEKKRKYVVSFQAKGDKNHRLRPEAYAINFAGEHSRLGPEDRNVDTLRLIASAGIDLVEVGVPNCWYEDRRDWTRADETLDLAIKAHPSIKFVLRFNVDAPEWMLKAHPDWKMSFEEQRGRIPSRDAASPSCRAYRSAVCDHIRAFARHFRESYPDHFAGVHPCGQNSGEWFYQDSYMLMSGYDAHTLAAWRSYLATRGLPDADVPTPAERYAAGNGEVLIDPIKGSRMIEFNRFLQLEMSDFVAQMVRACREGAGENKLVVMFYGYTWELHFNKPSPASTGHMGLMNFLDKSAGEIDILCGPISYAKRRFPDGVASVMSAAETLSRRGVLWLNEDDTRTHLCIPVDMYQSATNVWQSCNVMLRNTAQEAIRGLGSWWMDLAARGWYDDKRIWEVQRQLWPMEWKLLGRHRPYTPDMAAIVGEESLLFVAPDMRHIQRPLVYLAREQFDISGVRYGQYLLEDVLSRPPEAKLYIYQAAFYLDESQRRQLAMDRMLHPERTRVWCYAPAYLTEHGSDDKMMVEITGFSAVRVDKEGDPIRPRFSPVGGEVWTRYPDGNPSVAVKQTNGGGFDVFCGTPELTAELVRRAATLAGIHNYLAAGEANVCADAGFVSVRARKDGPVTIDFNGSGVICDAITGKTLGEGRTITLKLKAGETRLLWSSAGGCVF